MPRPSRLTPEVTRRIAAAVASGAKPADAAREQGISPSTFYDWMRRGRAGRAPYEQLAEAIDAAERDRAAPSGTRTDDLIGRARELSAARVVLRDLSAGRGSLTLLVGEPGIGKSRLLHRIATFAKAQDLTVLVGRAVEIDGAPTLWPWREALRDLIESMPTAALEAAIGPAAPEIAQLIPEVSDRLGPQEKPGELAAAEARFRLMDGLVRFLGRLAAERPMALLLDDLQWADDLSLALLEFLGWTVTTMPIAVVAAYRQPRSERLADVEASLARHPGVRDVELAGLAPDETRQLIEDLAGAPPDPSLADSIHARTRGNPFFVTELARGLASGHDGRVPTSVQHAVRQRLGGLRATARRVLQAAAVVGDDFDLALLEEISGEADAGVALDDAIAARFAEPVEKGMRRYRFHHALVRDVLYLEMAESERSALHGRVAAALERRAAGDDAQAALLAAHFFAAGSGTIQKALDYTIRAADRAVADLAFDVAARRYERALAAQALISATDGRREAELQIRLADCHNRSGRFEESKPPLRRALDIARRLDDAELFGRAATSFGAELMTGPIVSTDAETRELLEEACERLGREDSAVLVRALARLSIELHFADDRTHALELATRAVDMAHRLDDPATLAYALSRQYWAFAGSKSLRERLAIDTEMAEAARRANDAATECRARFLRATDLLELGALAEADREWATSERLGTRARDPQSVWMSACYRGMRATVDGRLEEAESFADRSRDAAGRIGYPEAELARATLLNPIRFEQGRMGELEDIARPAAARIPGWRTALAWGLAETDRLDEARRELEHFADASFENLPHDGVWLAGMCHLALVASTLEDARHGRTLYDLLLAFRERFVPSPFALTFYGSVEYFLGRLAATFSDRETAAAHYEEAIRRNDRIGVRLWAARARVHYARLLLEAREGVGAHRAADLLREAESMANEAGQVRLLQEIRNLSPRATADRRTAFRREGDEWHVGPTHEPVKLRGARGLEYLSILLREPGRSFHVLDLVGSNGHVHPKGSDVAPADALGDAGSLLDAEAREAYRDRLRDLREELEDAEARRDGGAAERASTEIEFIEAELTRAFGLGGRDRKAASAVERARLSVTRAIRRAVDRVRATHDDLGTHLDRSLRTGTFCSYEPEPENPIRWELG